MLLCVVSGAIVGIIIGTLLGWKRVVEMLDEVNELKYENEKLKKEAKTEVIEIRDNRAQPDNYFIPF
jgi:uncharacterized membrane protein (DUF106 family)